MPPKRVLIVDNNRANRESLKYLLAQRNLEVLEACTCEEALNVLGKEELDAVLTDTELPTKSGLYLLFQVKQKYAEIEVILLTSNASSYNLLQALRNGAYDFIVRPIDSGEILFNALDRAFEQVDLRRRKADLIRELEVKNHALKQALELSKALNESVDELASAKEVGEVLKKLLGLAMEKLRAQRGFLGLFDQATGELGIKVSEGIPHSLTQVFSSHLPAGLMLAIARRGKPVLIPENPPEKLAALANEAERQVLLSQPGLVSAPLRFKNRVVGLVVLLGHPEDQAFSEPHLQFITQLSHHAALAVEKAGIIHQLRRGKACPAETT